MFSRYIDNFEYNSKFKILKGGKISLVVSALVGTVVIASAAPTDGVVTAGTATISQSGNITNINQSTQKASINWQNFSIAANETVNFNQPNVNSITLNRVIGNEKSIIDGALNANGQVWILNSNGILFSKDAKINTAGIVATTAQLSDMDFQSGNYNFKNASSNSVVNLGTIEVSEGGYVVLASNEVRNSGTIKAVKGKVHLTGASEYTVNLNGNSIVNLVVTKGVLDAMVENSGTIIANGGEIYLTTNAVNELLKGVVNNTGIIEANSLDDITGKVELFAHGGTANIGGSIIAEDGFVETSGREFTISEGTTVKAAEWLIDPINITIDATLASSISTALNSGNVVIQTTGSCTGVACSGSGSDGDITVSSAITKSSGSKTKLTLAADRDISVNAAISGSSGSSLDIVLASRYNGATLGGVYVGSNLKSYGGDITIGGGDMNASGFAVTHSSTPYGDNTSGIFIGTAIIDATSDGTGTSNNTLPTATTGGNITMRGKGDLINAHQFNAGVYFQQHSTIGVTTGGTGSIHIEGHGGKANGHFWDVAAVGILWESANTYIKSNNGDVTIKGYAGTVADSYGISSGNTFIGTGGYLNIEGDSYMIRGGTLNLNVGGSGDIKAPLLGLSTYSLVKTGSGILNLWGDANNWHNNKPTGTTDTQTNGTFTDASNSLNLVNLTRANALYAFGTVPTTITTVTQSAATPLTTTTTPTTTTTTSTTTQKTNDVEKVITSIVNNQQINIVLPTNINVPVRTFLPTQPIVLSNNLSLRLGIKDAGSVNLVSQTVLGQPNQVVTLNELKTKTTQTNEERNTQVQDVRVSLNENSIVALVNGGVNLPTGVDQEFYVVRNNATDTSNNKNEGSN
jgi:filamentous hemagglutinin family protein